jgi:hypothetical protein
MRQTYAMPNDEEQNARDLIVEQFASRDEVDHCETSVINDVHRQHQLPCFAGPA